VESVLPLELCSSDKSAADLRTAGGKLFSSCGFCNLDPVFDGEVAINIELLDVDTMLIGFPLFSLSSCGLVPAGVTYQDHIQSALVYQHRIITNLPIEFQTLNH